jgi:ribosomal protein S18 acetylase RimI-like enzyme
MTYTEYTLNIYVWIPWRLAYVFCKLSCMNIEIIRDVRHPQLPFIKLLYEDSFSRHERRDWEQVTLLLEEPAMKLGLIRVKDESYRIQNIQHLPHEFEEGPVPISPPTPEDKKGDFVASSTFGSGVGFAIWWEMDNWYYIEHMAIDATIRNKGYGKLVMAYLAEFSGNRLVLETSLPDNANAKRRIHFYERQGLVACKFAYVQPPYRHGEALAPMLLMSMPPITDRATFNNLTTLIKEQVYERFY